MSTAPAPAPAPAPATPARLRLYELPEAFAALDAAIDELDGELPPDLEQRLDALELALEDKAEAVAGLVRQAEGESEFFAAEAERLGRRGRVAANRAARLKGYLQSTLERLGRDRLETPRFKLSLQRNGSPSIRWTRDLAELPETFLRVSVELDGAKAREAHKAGTLPEGFDVVTGKHLRIR